MKLQQTQNSAPPASRASCPVATFGFTLCDCVAVGTCERPGLGILVAIAPESAMAQRASAIRPTTRLSVAAAHIPAPREKQR